MEYKGQGAIEYLLIIGAAILVVAIVILAVTGALGGAKGGTTTAGTDANAAYCQADCNFLGACTGTVNGSTGVVTDSGTGCNKIAPESCKLITKGASPNITGETTCTRK